MSDQSPFARPPVSGGYPMGREERRRLRRIVDGYVNDRTAYFSVALERLDDDPRTVYVVHRLQGAVIKRERVNSVAEVTDEQARYVNYALRGSFEDWRSRPRSLCREHNYVGDMIVAGTAALLAAVTLAKDPPALLTAVVAVYLLAVLCYVGRHIYRGLR